MSNKANNTILNRVEEEIDNDTSGLRVIPTSSGVSQPLRVALKDGGDRTALNTVFGEAVVGNRKPTLSIQFGYGLRENRINTTVVGSGTYGIENSMLCLNTGTDANGEMVVESRESLRYIPGHQSYANFTAVFDDPQLNSYQRIGLYYDEAGMFIGYEDDGNFYFTKRSNSIDENYLIDTSGLSFTPDWQKGNIFQISYGFLGFAAISLEIMNPKGGWELLYKIEYPNSATVPHISNTFLALRGEVANTGNTSDIKLCSASLSCGLVDGAGADPSFRRNLYDNGTVAITGDTNLFMLRNKSTYATKENRITNQLKRCNLASDLTKVGAIVIEKNPTILTVGTWSDISVDSTMEVNTTNTWTIDSGEIVAVIPIAKTDKVLEDLESDIIKAFPNDTLGFSITTAGAGDIQSSTNWFELF